MTRLALVVSVLGALMFGGGAEAANILSRTLVKSPEANPVTNPTPGNTVLTIPGLGLLWMTCEADGGSGSVGGTLYFFNNTQGPLMVMRLNESFLEVVNPGTSLGLFAAGSTPPRSPDGLSFSFMILGPPTQPFATATEITGEPVATIRDQWKELARNYAYLASTLESDLSHQTQGSGRRVD